jgi:hypothetical protein
MGDFLTRLRCEKGFEIVLTTLVITGLIALGSGLYSLKKGAEEAKADRVDVTKYSEISASGDPGKDQEKNSAGLVEIAVKGGETAVGVYDDTGLLIILDKSGTLKVKDAAGDDGAEEDEKIKAGLAQKQLPDGKLEVDIAKAVKKHLKRKSKNGTSDQDLDELVLGIMEDIEDQVKLIDDLQEEDYEDIDDLDILGDLEKELEDKGLLEDPEKIELKKKLSRLESEKKYLEEKLVSYQEYEDKGYIVADTSGLNNLNDRLEDVESKISQLNSSLGDEAASKVTLSGQGDLRGFSESSITITIDLETGRVTGNIICYGSQPYDGESGIYCRYKFSSELNGSIDQDSGKLTVRASGYVNGISGGVCAGVKPTSYSTTLEGTLDESSAYISGSSSMGGTWQASSSN